MKFPNEPRKGEPVGQAIVEMLRYLRSITVTGVVGGRVQTTPNGTTIVPPTWKERASAKTKRLPFEVELFNSGTTESPTWKVRVHPGKINERVPGVGNEATKNHEPGNLYVEASDPPVLTEFSVSSGQGVFIKVDIKKDGTVGTDEVGADPVNIEIASADPGPNSTHYQPVVDTEDYDGETGIYYYKLAKIVAGDGGVLTVEKFLTGSHISHFQELPAVKSMRQIEEGVGVVPKQWNNDNRYYELRALIEGFGNLTIETLVDEVEIRGNKINNEIHIIYGDIEPSVPDAVFVDGLIDTGTEVIGDEDPPVEVASPIRIKVPTVVQMIGDAQVTVTNTGAVGDIYEVRGNSKDGYLSVNGVATALEWKDGLVTAEGGVDIEVDGMPEGAAGDMLYHNGTDWVILANPGAPTSPNRNFLVHDGTAPAWVEMEAKEIQICDSGTPVTKTIYVDL
jgi:hypothetical protein